MIELDIKYQVRNVGRTETKSKEMTLDCARDPGRMRTGISSSYWGVSSSAVEGPLYHA